MVGKRIAHYKITAKLGQGGMGEVYRATDLKLDREVAIKVLPAEVGSDPSRRQRFINEARAASALTHPHVCTIYEVGEAADGAPFIAMEYIEGRTLDRHPKLDIQAITRIGIQVVDALEAAHSKGIVHRDIKASNICVDRRKQVKVLDFGLAMRLTYESSEEEAPTELQTQEGKVLGTPNYMSPEQALGNPVDYRTDIFSFGIVLYELTTGKLPFCGSSPAETTSKIVNVQPESIIRLNYDTPPELEQIILKCLRKDVESRYQSTKELLVDLRNLSRALEPSQTLSSEGELNGLLTLLYLEVADVNALKQSLGSERAAKEISALHHGILNDLSEIPRAVDLGADADTILLGFSKPSEAVQFALDLQREKGQVPFRIGVHLGELVNSTEKDVRNRYGPHVSLCASLAQLGNSGSILMGRAVFDSARQVIGGDRVLWANHGNYVFKATEEPVEVCEVAAEGVDLKPPLSTETAQRKVTADEEPVLGWRPAVGQIVPNTDWRLERCLGEGGFGEVWLGRHGKLKCERVFKFCFRADRAQSLRREVTLFRLLKDRVGQHPGIVGIQDVYFDEPPFYLVMNYARGGDLKKWCDEHGGVEQLSEDVKLELVAQVGEALQAAHDAGVIHRDVKPANILVEGQPESPDGITVKLTDFGIGQVVDREALSGITAAGFTETLLPSSSSVAGTQVYLAPEIMAGSPASLRSDIYSLGVVLYQLKVSDFRRPVTGDWAKEISEPLLREDLEQCFAWKPEERFSGAGQLAKHLRSLPQRRAAQKEREAAMAAKTRAAYWRGAIRAAAVAAVFVIAIAALASWAFQSQRTARQLAEARRQEAEARRIELYAAQINLAHQAWNDGDYVRAQNFIAAQRPSLDQPDLRGFEWRYLWGLCRDESLLTLDTFANESDLAWYESNNLANLHPDGSKLATVDGAAIRVWDMSNHREINRLDLPADQVTALVFSPRDSDLLAISTGESVLQWHVTSDAPATVLADRRFVEALAYSPDGKKIALGTGWGDGRIEVWDIESATPDWVKMPAHFDANKVEPALCLAFSPDGTQVASGGGDTKIKLWDVATGEEIGPPLVGHTAYVLSLQFSPDAQLLASSGIDSRILIWDVATLRQRTELLGHRGRVRSVHFAVDGETLFSGGDDHTIRCWDVASARQLKILRGHTSVVHSLAGFPDGQSVLSISLKATKIWSASPIQSADTLVDHKGWLDGVVLSPDGKLLAVADYHAHAVKLWDVASRRLVGSLSIPTGGHLGLAVSPDGRLLATGGEDQTVRLWNLSQREELATHSCESGVYGVTLSSRGRFLGATTSRGLQVWSVESGHEIQLIKGDATAVTNAAFSPREDLLATSSTRQAEVSVWDIGTGKLVDSIPIDSPGRITFSPDGRLLAVSTSWASASIIDLQKSETIRHLTGLSGGTFAFSPDSKTLVCAGDDGTVKLWNIATGQILLTLHHVGPVTGVTFSNDGDLMATSGADGTVRLWPAASLSAADAL